MARLITPEGKQVSDPKQVAALAHELGLTLHYQALPATPEITALLARSALDPAEQQQLLQELDSALGEAVQGAAGASRDLVVLHESVPNLAALRQQFVRVHTHADDEIRYILAGTGYFGIVRGDGSQVLLETGPGDYLAVPAGAEHWFTLGANPQLKALRIFSRESHWAADYTGRQADPALLALQQA